MMIDKKLLKKQTGNNSFLLTLDIFRIRLLRNYIIYVRIEIYMVLLKISLIVTWKELYKHHLTSLTTAP